MGPQASAVPRREAHRSPHPRRRPPPASERSAPGQVPAPAGSTERGAALAPRAPVPTHPSIAEQDRARAAGQEPRTGRLRENGGLACTETAERCRVPGSAPRPPPIPRTRPPDAHAPRAPLKLLPSAARAEPAREAPRACPAWAGRRERGAFRARPSCISSPSCPSCPRAPSEVRGGQPGAAGAPQPMGVPSAPPGPHLLKAESFRTWSQRFLVPELGPLLRESVRRDPGTPGPPGYSPDREPCPHRPPSAAHHLAEHNLLAV